MRLSRTLPLLLTLALPALAQQTDLAPYVGLYRPAAEPDAIRAVLLDSGSLSVAGERTPRTHLVLESPDHFAAPSTPLHVTFVRDASGKVTALSTGNATLAKFSDTATPLNHFRPYTRTEAMIPARDGVKLHVVILRPVDSEKHGEPLPFLMQRTPYGVDGATTDGINAGKPEYYT